MIKKLRLQFILVSMISIFLVMSAIIMTINFSNFYAIENSTRGLLTEILNTDINKYPGIDGLPPEPGQELPKNYEKIQEENFIYAYVTEEGNVNKLVYKFRPDFDCEALILD